MIPRVVERQCLENIRRFGSVFEPGEAVEVAPGLRLRNDLVVVPDVAEFVVDWLMGTTMTREGGRDG